MKRPPRPAGEAVLTKQRGLLVLMHGTMMSIVTLSAFWIVYRGDEGNVEKARTVAFGVAAFSQLFFSFGCRSHSRTMPQLRLLSNPWLLGAVVFSVILQVGVMLIPAIQKIFDVSAALTWEWALIGICSIIPVTVIEVVKLLKGVAQRYTAAEAERG